MSSQVKYILFFLLIMPLVFHSCIKQKEEANTEKTVESESVKKNTLVISSGFEWKFDTISFERKVHVDNDTLKQAMHIMSTLVYPTSFAVGVDFQNVKKTISRIVTQDSSFIGTPKEAFENSINSLISDALSYGKEWEMEDNPYIEFSSFEEQTTTITQPVSRYWLTVYTHQYSYLGGAHGSTYVKYDNIDTQTGNIIKEQELFKHDYKNILAGLIQEKVKYRNSSKNKDEYIALLIEINEIEPNGNFYLNKDSIVYVYNQYEIAPYVQGIVEIAIPYNEIKPIINPQYSQIIEKTLNTQ